MNEQDTIIAEDGRSNVRAVIHTNTLIIIKTKRVN